MGQVLFWVHHRAAPILKMVLPFYHTAEIQSDVVTCSSHATDNGRIRIQPTDLSLSNILKNFFKNEKKNSSFAQLSLTASYVWTWSYLVC